MPARLARLASRRRSLTATIGLATCVTVLAGCGSTVQQQGNGTASLEGSTLDNSGLGGTTQPGGASGASGLGSSSGSSGAGVGGSGSGLSGGAGSTGGAGGPGSGTAPGAAGSTQGSTKSGSQTTSPGSTSAAAVPETGPGWDKSTVYLGVTTQKDAQQAFGSVGVKGLDPGDQEGEANAVASYLNARGGLFGRKIKLVFRDVSTIKAAEDPNNTGESVCTYFSQDHRVLALVSPVTLIDNDAFRTCMAKAHVPLFSATVNAYDATLGAQLTPYWYQLVAPNWDNFGPLLVQALGQQGYFSGWNARLGKAAGGAAKIGVLYPDDPLGQRIRNLIEQALSRAGHPAAYAYGYVNGSSNTYPSAVSAFEQRGITHVIVPNADLLAFQLSASSQQYKPRYAIGSYNAPYSELQSNSPQGQNNGAVGVGWLPGFDVDDSHDKYTTPGRKSCLALEAKDGQHFGGKRLALTVAEAFCDGIQLVAQGAAAGHGLDPTSIYRGVQAIGPRFRSAVSFGSALGGNRVFVPGAVRNLAFDNGCQCFKYTSRTARRVA